MKFKEYHNCESCEKKTKTLHGKLNNLCMNCYCKSDIKYKRIPNGRDKQSMEYALGRIYEMKTYGKANCKVCVCSFPSVLQGIKFKIQIIDGN